MVGSLGEVLPLAAVVALSPLPIIAVVVVLLGADGRRRGFAMLLGRLLGIAVVVAGATLAAEWVTWSSGSPLIGAIAQLVVGALLVVLGLRKLARPRGAEATPPRWMASLERLSVPRAFGFGVTVSLVNPKELAMAFGAGVVVGSKLPDVGAALAVGAVYTVIALAGMAVPLVIAVLGGETADARLARIRSWLVRHETALMAVVLFVFGVMLVGDAITTLA